VNTNNFKKEMRSHIYIGFACALAFSMSSLLLPQVSEATGPTKTSKAKKKKKSTNKKKAKPKKQDKGPTSAAKLKREAKPAKKPTPTLKPPKSVQRIRLDSAVTQFKEKRYGIAAAALYEMLGDTRVSESLKDEAEYHLGKSLYRLKVYQAALHHFTNILSRGPDSSFYGPSLEWCLFIARKVVADEVVLNAVARYASYEFPAVYESEFRYLLSRFHYMRAVDLQATQAALVQGKTRVEENTTGGKSFKGDLFGDGDDEDELEEAESQVKRKGKSGLSLGADIFGSDDDDEEEEEESAESKESTRITPASLDDYQPQDHVDVATRHVMRVKPSSSFAARAKFVEAVLLYRSGKENDALESFKTVVRMTKAGAPNENKRLRQLAFFQLARTHFGASQPSFSLYYYEKMRRFTYEWLEALYESSWAEFRLGSYEKSLGNLLTLHSPFFEEQYFPESHILKAVVYYENCRYNEAKGILADFLKAYEPILGELRKLTAQENEADKYYEILANLRAGLDAEQDRDKARILSKILTIALDDPRLSKLDASYQEVVRELESSILVSLGATHKELAAHVKTVIAQVRDDLRLEAGKAVKRRLDQEKRQIKKLIQEAIRIDIETAASEQAKMEASLTDTDSQPKEMDKVYVEWTDDEKIVWPFEEEYWRDELGTYQLTLGKSCR